MIPNTSLMSEVFCSMEVFQMDTQRIAETVAAFLPDNLLIHEVIDGENGFTHLHILPSGPASITYVLTATWIGEGWPKQIEETLAQDTRPDLVVARHLSSSARQLAEEHGLSWIDQTGAGHLRKIDGGQLLDLMRPGTAPVNTPDRRWTRGVVAIAEALLMDVPGTVAGIQEYTGLSVGSCVRGLRTLTELGLLTSSASRGRNSNRRIADVDMFLVAYRQAAEVQRAKLPVAHAHVLWRDPLTFIRNATSAWDESGLAWAATGALAALVIAPHLTNVGAIELYVDRNSLHELYITANTLGATPSDEQGARITLRPFPTNTTLRHIERRDGLCLAPTPRVYADLFSVGVRGGEAAQHLREVTDLGGAS
jgi:hypothetical protein